ncbi:unnamed protein product [marine sediment metagenome]|uniref:Uncharacterized protein n=1 Tax=marine sediment metagenome TaxID=412755 RepID=X0RQX6_9ZZZZ
MTIRVKKEVDIFASNPLPAYVVARLNNKEIKTLLNLILKEKYLWINLSQRLELIQEDLGGREYEKIAEKVGLQKKN